MTIDHAQCCICSQIAGERSNDLISLALGEHDYVRRVPLETTDFALIPSVGPVAVGHVLICPKRHVRAMAHLTTTEAQELSIFRLRVVERLRRISGAPIHYFEHGAARDDGRTVCTVDHGHLHLVPADVDVLNVLLAHKPWQSIGSAPDDLVAAVGTDEYLFYETPDQQRFALAAASAVVDSQYLRRVFAQALGGAREWNWRESLRLDEVEATYRSLEAGAMML